jgi:prepilin-type N-terminal cleavage/methylation domain-containing protein
MKNRVRRGFTLPEILVTVTVVAVLAAVVVPAVTQYAGKGDAPSTKQDVDGIRQGVTGFVSDVRSYPDSLGDLIKFTATDSAKWKGPYSQITLSSGKFTSGGLGVTFQALFHTDTSSKTLDLNVDTPTCKTIYPLDVAGDGTAGKSTGNVVYFPHVTSESCASASDTVTIDSAFYRLMVKGS